MTVSDGPEAPGDSFVGETWHELLDSVGLARPALDQSASVRRGTRREGLDVVIVDFTLPRSQVQAWVEASLGRGAQIPRAWVTYSSAKDVLGISDLPSTWRLEVSKEAGSPRERYIVIDDADPARVTVGISATYGPLGGQRT